MSRENTQKDVELAYARLSPSGEGGIGLFHVFGEGVETLLYQIFTSASDRDQIVHNQQSLHYGWLSDEEEGEVVDEVIVRVIPGDNSLTGQLTVELNTHSGPAILQRIGSLLETHGADSLTPEAYLNKAEIGGVLDAVRRDAYDALLQAETQRAAAVLVTQLQGELSRTIGSLHRSLLNDDSNFTRQEIADTFENLLRRGRAGVALTEPPEVCILGPPNAGKSTLMNTLSQKETSIVHQKPGTTRDVVYETVYAHGFPLHVRDTAGLRVSAEQIEKKGIERARTIAGESDLVLWVAEHVEEAMEEPDLISDKPTIRVRNKEDLTTTPEYGDSQHDGQEVIHVSAKVERGIQALRGKILDVLNVPDTVEAGMPVPFRPAHMKALKQARGEWKNENSSRAASILAEVFPVSK